MKQADQLVQKIELAESIIGLRKDGILHVYFRPHAEITVEYQLQQLEVLMQITGGKKHPAIYEADEYVTVGSAARDHAIELESRMPILCNVVFVKSLAHKIISEFYYKFNKPKKPYKVFSDFEEGIAWLNKTRRELEDASASG
jgi:hypothetical protein